MRRPTWFSLFVILYAFALIYTVSGQGYITRAFYSDSDCGGDGTFDYIVSIPQNVCLSSVGSMWQCVGPHSGPSQYNVWRTKYPVASPWWGGCGENNGNGVTTNVITSNMTAGACLALNKKDPNYNATVGIYEFDGLSANDSTHFKFECSSELFGSFGKFINDTNSVIMTVYFHPVLTYADCPDLQKEGPYLYMALSKHRTYQFHNGAFPRGGYPYKLFNCSAPGRVRDYTCANASVSSCQSRKRSIQQEEITEQIEQTKQTELTQPSANEERVLTSTKESRALTNTEDLQREKRYTEQCYSGIYTYCNTYPPADLPNLLYYKIVYPNATTCYPEYCSNAEIAEDCTPRKLPTPVPAVAATSASVTNVSLHYCAESCYTGQTGQTNCNNGCGNTTSFDVQLDTPIYLPMRNDYLAVFHVFSANKSACFWFTYVYTSTFNFLGSTTTTTKTCYSSCWSLGGSFIRDYSSSFYSTDVISQSEKQTIYLETRTSLVNPPAAASGTTKTTTAFTPSSSSTSSSRTSGVVPLSSTGIATTSANANSSATTLSICSAFSCVVLFLVMCL